MGFPLKVCPFSFVSLAVRLFPFSCSLSLTPIPLSPPPSVSHYSVIATINLTQVLHSAGLIVRATCPEVGGNEYEDRSFHISNHRCHHFKKYIYILLVCFPFFTFLFHFLTVLLCSNLRALAKPFRIVFTHRV